MESKSPIFCNHANEVPAECPCKLDCYCKDYTCKPRPYIKKIETVIFPPDKNAYNTNIWEPIKIYENAINNVRLWLSTIYSPSKLNRAVYIQQKKVDYSIQPELIMHARIWTSNNEFIISARIHPTSPKGYLSCSALSRQKRSGETWERGNDIADGELNINTWTKIILNIVKYETEEIKSEKWKDKYING